MALKRTTKSVLLHDGPFDEADRFLLRSPATDYLENYTFHKEGTLTKRAGNELFGTVPNGNGNPFLIESIGKNLHVLTEDGARSYINGEWKEVDATGFVGTKEVALETAPAGGIGHIDMLPVDDSSGFIEWYVVVYEVRERSTSVSGWGEYEDIPKHVMVQVYDKNGVFVSQTRIDGARSPKVFRHLSQAGAFAKVWYHRDSDDVLVCANFDVAQGIVTFENALTSIPVSKSYVWTPHARYEYASDDVPSGVFLGGFRHTRLGASTDGHSRYHIAQNVLANSWYILYLRDNGAIWAAHYDSDLVQQDQAQLAGASGDDANYEVLDIAAAGFVGGDAVAMWTEWDAPNGDDTDLTTRVVVATLSMGGTVTETNRTTVYSTTADETNTASGGRRWRPSTITHGGLSASSANISWMAYEAGQCVGGRIENRYACTRYWSQGLRHGVLDSGLNVVSNARLLPSHRLASRPFRYDQKIYAFLQQHIDHSERIRNKTSQNRHSSVAGARYPRTTVLVCFGDDSSSSVPKAVATVDDGISKVTEYGESELAVHVPRAHLYTPSLAIGSSILVPNRSVTQAEDISEYFYEYTSSAGAENGYARIGSSEAPADAMIRVHHITKGNQSGRQLYATPIGDGIVVSTAVPLWFDGRHFGELSPLDRPEIVAVEDAYMLEDGNVNLRAPSMGYAQGNEPNDQDKAAEWRRLQVVVGYYDARGNKHRSAPSQELWVWCFNPESDAFKSADFPSADYKIPEKWWGKDVTVYFTTPLSVVPDDVEYFVEVYASDGPDDDPVLIETGVIDPNDMSSTQRVKVQLIRLTGKTQTTGEGIRFQIPLRSAESVYTAGGELAADPWPAFTSSVATSTRLFALDAVNKGKVLVSKRFQDFIAPEYNATLDINLGDERDLLCIGKLDDKTVVFEKDDIHIIYGDGPLNNGEGEDFAVHYISTDVGCEDQESIVECPAGLVFYRKERGFYLLDRNMQIKYIGDKVHNLTKGIDVVSAELVSAEGHIRFLCKVIGTQQDPDGADPDTDITRPPRPIYGNAPPDADFAIVWDYEKDQWGVFANYPGKASCIHQGRYTRLLDDWSVWQERENTDPVYDDPTGKNRTLLRTTWIPVADNVQGYGRVYKMIVLGRYLSSLAGGLVLEGSDIQVKVWYDYEEGADVTPQTKYFSWKDFGYNKRSQLWGPGQIRAERFQFEISPPEGKGRCQAVKFEFEEMTPPAEGSQIFRLGQGFEISAIDFEIGVDPRVTRMLGASVRK